MRELEFGEKNSLIEEATDIVAFFNMNPEEVPEKFISKWTVVGDPDDIMFKTSDKALIKEAMTKGFVIFHLENSTIQTPTWKIGLVCMPDMSDGRVRWMMLWEAPKEQLMLF